MSHERSMAFRRAINTPTRHIEILKDEHGRAKPVSEFFGCMTFGLSQMREKLPKEAYSGLLKTLENGKKLQKETADAIALAIKEWSVSKGVTHFCHWFSTYDGINGRKT